MVFFLYKLLLSDLCRTEQTPSGLEQHILPTPPGVLKFESQAGHIAIGEQGQPELTHFNVVLYARSWTMRSRRPKPCFHLSRSGTLPVPPRTAYRNVKYNSSKPVQAA